MFGADRCYLEALTSRNISVDCGADGQCDAQLSLALRLRSCS